MKLIGVTGAIASGKSTLAKLLKDKGAVVIDADKAAREVMKPGTAVWNETVKKFGKVILKSDKSIEEIDRVKLAEIVFSNPKSLNELNKIIHPAVLKNIERQLEGIKKELGDDQIVVLDVPLLIEVGWHELCDMTVVVRATERLRLQRLLSKGITEEDAKRRMESQKEKEHIESFADCIIDNNGAIDALEAAVDRIWGQINNHGIM